MSLEFAEDGGNRERVERDVPIGVVPVGRLHETEQGDLDEIEFRFASVAETAGALGRDPAVVDDQLVANGRIAGCPETLEAGSHLVSVQFVPAQFVAGPPVTAQVAAERSRRSLERFDLGE